MARVALAAVILVLAGAPAFAQVDSPLVRAGIAAYEALDYARAVSLLERARAERLTIDEEVAALRTLAFAKVALGDEAGARKDFEALLRAAPATALDRSVSPRIRVVFEEARANVAAAAPVPPTPEPSPAPVVEPPRAEPPPVLGVRVEPSPAREGEALRVYLDPPAGHATLELSTRRRGDAEYRLRTLGSGAVTVDVVAEPPALELFAVARAPSGAELARAGDASKPIAVEVTPAPAFYERGWFWGVSGGVAGAAVLTGVLIAALAPRGDGSLVVVPR